LLLLGLLRGRIARRRRSRRSWRRRYWLGDHDGIFTVGEPDIVDRVLDRMQPWACGKHPAGEDAAHLTLQRGLLDRDEGAGVLRLVRRPREARARRQLQRTELHGLTDRHVEADDAAGDLVEA